MRAPGGKGAIFAKRSALRAQRPLVVKALLQPDMNDAEGLKISILCTEWAVDNVDVIHQFRAKGLEKAEITLAVGLRALVLGYVVYQDLNPAVQAAMVEVESKPAKLERLAASLVLPGIDSTIEGFEKLIVAQKQSVLVNSVIAAIDCRIGCAGRDDQCLLLPGNDIVNLKAERFGRNTSRKSLLKAANVFAGDTQNHRPAGTRIEKAPSLSEVAVRRPLVHWAETVTPTTSPDRSSTTTPLRSRPTSCCTPVKSGMGALVRAAPVCAAIGDAPVSTAIFTKMIPSLALPALTAHPRFDAPGKNQSNTK
jgi:hypothetical protein